jgi:hypothetical protein
MFTLNRLTLLIACALVACKAQEASPTIDSGSSGAANVVTADLLKDIESLETKFVDLAGAFPETTYNWQPDSARSVRRVLLHVAADNYVLPAMLGYTPDPSVGLTADYKTGVAYENRNVSKDSVVAELRRSFGFLKESLGNASVSSMSTPVSMFGQSFTGQAGWILTVTHLHEHLGQLIAYARMNGIKPPWS